MFGCSNPSASMVCTTHDRAASKSARSGSVILRNRSATAGLLLRLMERRAGEDGVEVVVVHSPLARRADDAARTPLAVLADVPRTEQSDTFGGHLHPSLSRRRGTVGAGHAASLGWQAPRCSSRSGWSTMAPQ